jgi:boron transporter
MGGESKGPGRSATPVGSSIRSHGSLLQQQGKSKKTWHSGLHPSARRNHRAQPEEDHDGLSRQPTQRSHASTRRKPQWWKVRLFRGMIDDVKRRAPYYWSDWKDAWDYRVAPATIYMYFAKYAPSLSLSSDECVCGSIQNEMIHFPHLLTTPHSILPALAFSLDMFDKTGRSFGVNEVLLASVLGAVVFSLAAAQPLVIVGVTGMCGEVRPSCAVSCADGTRPDHDFQLYRVRHHCSSRH